MGNTGVRVIKSATRPCGIYYVYLGKFAFQVIFNPKKRWVSCKEEF
jgi:hypothetical protein